MLRWPPSHSRPLFAMRAAYSFYRAESSGEGVLGLFCADGGSFKSRTSLRNLSPRSSRSFAVQSTLTAIVNWTLPTPVAARRSDVVASNLPEVDSESEIDSDLWTVSWIGLGSGD